MGPYSFNTRYAGSSLLRYPAAPSRVPHNASTNLHVLTNEGSYTMSQCFSLEWSSQDCGMIDVVSRSHLVA